MLENKWICRGTAVLGLMVCVMAAVPVYAAEKSVQVYIPVKAKTAMEITVKASGVSDRAGGEIPMPEDTTIHVSAGSQEMIGPITYSSADDYSYTVSGGSQSYEVNVQTTYDREGNLQAAVWCVLTDGTKNYGNALSFGASGTGFSDSESAVSSGSSVSRTGNVKTGDTGQMPVWIIVALAAVTLAAGTAAGRRKYDTI